MRHIWVPMAAMLPVLMLSACGGKADHEGGNDAARNAASAADDAAGAAGNAAAVANQAAHAAAEAAKAGAADEAAIRTVIDKVYAGYERKGESAYPLTPAFQAAWDRVLGKEGVMDGDPYCDCQDFDDAKFRHRIKTVTLTGDKARVAVEINGGWGDGWAGKWYELVRTPKGWQIDDMESGDGKGLKGVMQSSAPGSWDVGA